MRLDAVSPAPSNSEIVAAALREALARGDLRGGDQIKEAPLAAQIGLSRGPIRDALRILAAEDVVEIRLNRGAFVPEIRAVDVLEVYALRATLGSLAIDKLGAQREAPALGPVEDARSRVVAAVGRRNDNEAAVADLAFQQALVDAAGLRRLTREFGRLTLQVRIFISTLEISYADRLSTIAEEVEDLYEAVVKGDYARADRVWNAKFERWVRDFVDRIPEEDFDADLWIALTSRK